VGRLGEHKEEKQAHGEIETHHSGFLVAQDSYYVGYIKSIRKIYQQTGIDTNSKVGFAKIYSDKTATVAAEFLNSKVLPFFDEHRLSLLRVLTGRGTEYCGRPETHHYQLFTYLNDYMRHYSMERTNQGKQCQGRTPYEAFVEGKENLSTVGF
jgi:hypothetical protein